MGTWLEAPWQDLLDFLTDRPAFLQLHPEGLEINHLFFRDLRKYIWILEHSWAGLIDRSLYEFTRIAEPSVAQKNVIHKYMNDYAVTWYDEYTKDYLWWRNVKDLTKQEAYEIEEPPFNIHPSDNTWILRSASWELAPRELYHDWDVNSPMVFRYFEGAGPADDEYSNFLFLTCHPTAFYPKQTDPKEQYVPVQFPNRVGWQIKEKVEIRKEIITDPETLGPIMTPWRYGRQNYSGDTAPYVIVCKDYRHQKYYGSYLGWQYGNYGGMPTNGPDVELWNYNPKIVKCAYQNKIEAVLDTGPFRANAATSEFIANWKRWYATKWIATSCPYSKDAIVYWDNEIYRSLEAANNDTPPSAKWEIANVNEFEAWDDFPDPNHTCWGRNESPFEHYKYASGVYDWFFNYKVPYVPKTVVEQITEMYDGQINGYPEPSKAACLTFFDLDNLCGGWCPTWRYGMGRVSPYMRSQEMGEPSLRDAWYPNMTDQIQTGYPVGPFDPDRCWFSSRKTSYPAINQFDTNFATVLKILSPYEFEVIGEIEIKHDWMIHFCTSESQAIKIDNEFMQWAYVIESSFNVETNSTYIRVDREVISFTKIGWNPKISERHDIDEIYQGHEIKALIIWEMKHLLDLVNYKIEEPTFTVKRSLWYSDLNAFAPTPGELMARGTQEAALKVDSDPDTSSYWSTVVTDGDAGTGNALWGEYKDWGMGIGWAAKWNWLPDSNVMIWHTAIKIVWPTYLINAPEDVFVKYSQVDDINDGANYGGFYQEVDMPDGTVLSNNIVSSVALQRTHYRWVPFKANGAWHFLIPKILPAALVTIVITPGVEYEFFGRRLMGFVDWFQDAGVIVKLEWTKVPSIVWERSIIGHKDEQINIPLIKSLGD